jgi:membrane-bound lytic murein transglycosylase D
VRFLAGLNEQFGSLYLAAAAYNGGPGRVARGLTRYADELEGRKGDDAFFALAQKDYLRAETKDYVPKLIAAALVAKDPTRYGFDIAYDSEFVYDSVRVGPLTPLAAVATASNTPVAAIMDLNPHLLRGLTPPRDSFTVRVPLGRAAGFDSSFAALPVSDRTAFTRTLIRKGETLASLASRVDLSARQLAWYNPSLKPNRRGRLPVGSVVLIPAPGVLAAARDVPDPAIERYGTIPSRATHVVKRGESLGSIAARYGTSVAALKRLNGLKKGVIFPGQVIVVKGTPGSRRKGAVHARAETSAHDQPATRGKKALRAASAALVHVVKWGESLQSIARRNDTSTKALRKLNGLDGSEIRVGQKLIIKE